MRNDHRFMLPALLASVALCACTDDRGLASGNESIAQIRSDGDLEVYLKATPNSPLDYMSPAMKQHFLNSLVFTERGLGSFTYKDLTNLPSEQVHQILSLFGAESAGSLITKEPAPGNLSVFDDGDLLGYGCSNVQAACVPTDGGICLSNCGG
ncbi:MAG TPA: hypothetical protein VF469_25825 [Kofleriaceae bacterium]